MLGACVRHASGLGDGRTMGPMPYYTVATDNSEGSGAVQRGLPARLLRPPKRPSRRRGLTVWVPAN
jgi:hypothetical protein